MKRKHEAVSGQRLDDVNRFTAFLQSAVHFQNLAFFGGGDGIAFSEVS